MLVIRKSDLRIAVVDHKKTFGEKDQYTAYDSEKVDIGKITEEARMVGKEVRYYYQNLVTENAESIPAELIMWEIPPGNIQPFHYHDNVHEFTVVIEGTLMNIESKTFTEDDDIEKIMEQGIILEKGDMVIETPGVRHTMLNPSDQWTKAVTIKINRIEGESRELSSDWKR